MNSTIEKSTTLLESLSQLGLTHEQAEVFIIFVQNKNITVSEVARRLEIGRTKTYRIIDELKDKNLISELKTTSGSTYTPQTIENLEALIERKRHEVEQMQNSFESLKSLLTLNTEDQLKSGITSFTGMEGLKQVIWNTTKAKGVLKVFESARLNVFMDYGFSEDVRMQYLKNNIRTKDLTNQTHIDGWTNIQEFVDTLAECRYIDPKELAMSFEIYVYNDIVALIDYSDKNELFCLEIKNPALKMIIEQLFDFVWNRAKLMVVTGDRGEMEVELK